MTNLLNKLRSHVVPRDSEPLQSLLFTWGSRRGRPSRLPFSQERLLESVNDHPCLNRTRRTQRLDWSIKKFQHAKDALEELGFLRTEQIVDGPGRPEAFLVLTEDGYKYLRGQHIQPKRLHGSLEHHCAILRLKAAYTRLGYAVQITEPVFHGAIVDLLCTRGAERGAIEVINSNNVARDAEKCARLAPDTDWIHFVTTSRDLFGEYVSHLGKLLPPASLSKLQVSFLPDFLSTLPPRQRTEHDSPGECGS